MTTSGMFATHAVDARNRRGSARAGQTVARSTDSGAHPAAVKSASTVKPLSLPPPRHLHQGASRRIRHYPPGDVGSCSTG